MTFRLRGRWRTLRASLAPPYWEQILVAIGDARTVLDVGCGRASPLAAGRTRFDRLVGVDAFADAIAEARAAGTHDELVEEDVLRLAESFPPGSFDAVVAVDLLEHLDHADGVELLGAMERVARDRVVVFTPNGFVEQMALEGNPFQVHRSGWSPSALRERGYCVSGVHGLRVLRGEEAAIRFRPRRAWSLVADLTQPLARRVPRLAYHLLAVKDVTPA